MNTNVLNQLDNLNNTTIICGIIMIAIIFTLLSVTFYCLANVLNNGDVSESIKIISSTAVITLTIFIVAGNIQFDAKQNIEDIRDGFEYTVYLDGNEIDANSIDINSYTKVYDDTNLKLFLTHKR